jgi:uncharacterized protein
MESSTWKLCQYRQTLFTLARQQHQADELLGVRASVLTPGFLSAKFRDRVLEQAQPL